MSLKKYDRNFKDPGNLSQVLFCPICQEIFKRPVIISCGHTFCKHCIVTSHIKSKFCPTCRQRLSPSEKFIRNVFAEQIIDEQIVVCEQELCQWEGPLNSLQNHKKHCEFCPKVIENPLEEEQNNPIIITDDGLSSEEGSSSSIQILQEKSKKSISQLKKRKNGKKMNKIPQKKIHCLEEEEDEEEEIGVVSDGKDKKYQEEKMFLYDEEEEGDDKCFGDIYRLEENNRLVEKNGNNFTHRDQEIESRQSQELIKGSQSPDQDSLEIFSDKQIKNNQHQKIDQSTNPFQISQNFPVQVQESSLKKPVNSMRNMYPYGLEEIDEEENQNINYFQMKNNLESRNEKEVYLDGGSGKEDNIEINQENQARLNGREVQLLNGYQNKINDQHNQNNEHEIIIRKIEHGIYKGDKLRSVIELTKQSQKQTNEQDQQEKERRRRQEEWDRDCQRNPILPLLFGFEA